MTKHPHELAADIIALPTREQRAAALETVPAHWRDLVRAHVIDYFWRKNYRKQKDGRECKS